MGQILSDIVYFENQIYQFFKKSEIFSLLNCSNIDKQKCVFPVALSRVHFTLIFAGKSHSPNLTILYKSGQDLDITLLEKGLSKKECHPLKGALSPI